MSMALVQFTRHSSNQRDKDPDLTPYSKPAVEPVKQKTDTSNTPLSDPVILFAKWDPGEPHS